MSKFKWVTCYHVSSVKTHSFIRDQGEILTNPYQKQSVRTCCCLTSCTTNGLMAHPLCIVPNLLALPAVVSPIPQLRAGIPVASCQLRYCLADTDAAPTIAQCRAAGVTVLASGTLVGGLIADRWLGVACPSAAMERQQGNLEGPAAAQGRNICSVETVDMVAK